MSHILVAFFLQLAKRVELLRQRPVPAVEIFLRFTRKSLTHPQT